MYTKTDHDSSEKYHSNKNVDLKLKGKKFQLLTLVQ